MVEEDVLLKSEGLMPLKCRVWSSFFFLLLLYTGVPTGSKRVEEKICSIQSSKDVHMGSSFQIFCVFKKECSKLIYRDNVALHDRNLNSTTVSVSIVNLTRTTTVTCKCDGEPEPCGTDITPGYPPGVPQNLTCVREGELGNVTCIWETGWETYIQTTSRLWVQGYPPVDYPSVILKDGTLSASFPIPATQTQFSVHVNATNSLGSAASNVLSFRLNDIVKPLKPHIKKVECSSRQCQLYPEKAENIQLVEIRYRVDLTSWKTVAFNALPYSFTLGDLFWCVTTGKNLREYTRRFKPLVFLKNGMAWFWFADKYFCKNKPVQYTNSSKGWTIHSLNPYSLYTFQVRWKFSPTRGVWSEWSTAENKTDEEAPAAMLDAWYAVKPGKKHVQLFWKELSESEARGRIVGYNVSVVGKKISEFIKPTTCYSLNCYPCTISIFAMNSKGQSPARLIQLQPISTIQGHISIHKYVNNHSIALSWKNPVSAYLVEWYPAGLELDSSCKPRQFQWIRVEPYLNTINITGLQPAECYEVAVIFLSSTGAGKIQRNIDTWQSVPQQGPDCIATVKNDSVVVKWGEIPPKKRGGCLIKYSIYLQDVKGKTKSYRVNHIRRNFTIPGLTLGQQYKLWVSAWTEAGEGPKGNEHNIVTYSEMLSAEKPLALVVSVGGVVFLTCLFLLCICQFSSVHRRLSHCCHCLMPSIVPDPANSKWAKECASEKGEMKLQLYRSDSSMSEEEPDTVEVQEVPREKLLPGETVPTDGARHSGSKLNILEQEHHIPPSSYQPTTSSSYLKSFSHESTSSDATQASRSTDITVDYISTHGEEDEEEEEEEENIDMMDFFPCPTSHFLDPLVSIGGKLTLDTVKIDCSDFLDIT